MKALANHLGISVAEIKKRWAKADLDGDEQASLAQVFDLSVTVPLDGNVSTRKIDSGLLKLMPKKSKAKR